MIKKLMTDRKNYTKKDFKTGAKGHKLTNKDLFMKQVKSSRTKRISSVNSTKRGRKSHEMRNDITLNPEDIKKDIEDKYGSDPKLSEANKMKLKHHRSRSDAANTMRYDSNFMLNRDPGSSGDMDDKIDIGCGNGRNSLNQSRLNESGLLCCVCFDKQPDAVFMDCGHGGVCYDCSLDIWKTTEECFLCRSVILFRL